MSKSKDDFVYPAEQVLKKDLATLKNWPSEKRIRLFKEIEENADQYEFSFYKKQETVIPESQFDRDLDKLEAAKSLLAAAISEDPSSDQQEERYMERIPEDEIQWLVSYAPFRTKFMGVDKDQLEDLIKNQEGEVHEFVEQEIAGQIRLREELLDRRSEIRLSTISYFSDEFDRFLDLADEAVFLYIKNHGLPSTVEGIVDVANTTAEASLERDAIKEEIESKFDDLAQQLHHDIRDREQMLRADMRRLESQYLEGAERNELEAELTELRSEIESISKRRQEDISELTESVSELRDLESNLGERIVELERKRETTIEELKAETKDYASSLIDEELERLHARRQDLVERINHLQREQEQRVASENRFEAELQSLEEKLNEEISTIRESFRDEDGSPDGKAISAELARLYEMDYIGRFNTSVQETDVITLPGDEEFEVPEGYWDDPKRHQSGDHRNVLQSELETKEAEEMDQYPVGRYSIYEVQSGRFFSLGTDTKLVIEAVTKANLRAFGKNGFDAGPAGVDDLLDVVNEAQARAAVTNIPHLIGIASLTGWTEKVKEVAQNESQSRTKFSNVSICLIDLQSNEYFYDTSDPVVDGNINLFYMKIDSERVSECVDIIKNEYVTDPSIRIIKCGRVAERHDFEPSIVKRAFGEIEKSGLGEQGYPEGAKDLCLLIEQP